MVARTAAYLSHAAPGRLRFKVPSKRNDGTYFAQVREALMHCPGVQDVSVNPVAASILVHHDGPAEQVGACARDHGFFNLDAAGGRPHVLVDVAQRMSGLSGAVSGVVGRPINIWTLVFVSFVGLAIIQALRGHVLAPAVTLAWYAVGASMIAKGRPGDMPTAV